MVRYRERSPSERPHQGYRQQGHGQEQGLEGQEEQGLSPETIEFYGRTYRGRRCRRRRRCSRRRLCRIHRRRRRSCRRRRRRCCRRRHRRGTPRNQNFLSQKAAEGGGEDAEGATTELPEPTTPGWELRRIHLPGKHLARP
ncbi:protamine-2 isoform X2 [Microcebus murinus]|uniref:protamine-2 isoform X2 n=1 Tax=Microcebus murinus TaxID=30608 RepID=UPI0006432638|nr:protamine-2 isoform X2 [Microcebus murinus]